MDLAKAVYDRLAGDQELVAMLAKYAGAPAIFTQAFIPENAKMPYIWSYGNVSDQPEDTKTERGRDIFRDIQCFAAYRGDSSPLELIAKRVRKLFHRRAIAVDGATVIVASASGPVPAETDERAVGLIVHVRLRLEET